MASASPLGHTLRLAFYALTCVLGAVSTWYFNLRFMAAHPGGFELGAFVREAFSNDAAGSLSSDIGAAAMAGIPFMLIEGRRIGMKHTWVYVVLACSVAFGAAFPLFLLMRELKLAALSKAEGALPGSARPAPSP